MDHFVADDGSIRTYKIDEYNIDNILPGRNLLRFTKQPARRSTAKPLRFCANN